MSDKYKPLADYLRKQAGNSNRVTLSFEEIEKLLDDRLPASAYDHRAWWGNQQDVENRPQVRAWVEAGFEVESLRVEKKTGTISFKRANA